MLGGSHQDWSNQGVLIDLRKFLRADRDPCDNRDRVTQCSAAVPLCHSDYSRSSSPRPRAGELGPNVRSACLWRSLEDRHSCRRYRVLSQHAEKLLHWSEKNNRKPDKFDRIRVSHNATIREKASSHDNEDRPKDHTFGRVIDVLVGPKILHTGQEYFANPADDVLPRV